MQPIEPSAPPSGLGASASPTAAVLTDRDLERDADEIAALVTAKLRRNAVTFQHSVPIRIISITAVDPQHVRSIEPEAPRLDAAVTEPVWVVRALGPFGTMRGPTLEPRVADSGYLLISDADGTILATGFP